MNDTLAKFDRMIASANPMRNLSSALDAAFRAVAIEAFYEGRKDMREELSVVIDRETLEFRQAHAHDDSPEPRERAIPDDEDRVPA